MTFYTDPLVTLYLGDCLDVMPTLPAESVDAVVTDPPYGLGFMGKHWDHGVPNVDFWTAMLRVAKPGAYLLAFGGTRTVHRIAANIEDAGWIIRDQLIWIYASGFPKGRANLKPAHEPIVMARKPLIGTVVQNVTRYGTGAINVDGCRIGTERTQTRIMGGKGFGANFRDDGWVPPAESAVIVNPAGRWPSNVLLSDPELFDEQNPYVVGSGATVAGFAGATRRTDAKGGVTGWNAERAGSYVPGYGDPGGYSRFFRVPSGGRSDRPSAAENPQDDPQPSEPEPLAPAQDHHGEPRGAADYPTTFIIPKADRAERERGLAGTSTELHLDGAFAVICAKCNRQKINVPGAACQCEEPEWVRRSQKPRANHHPTVKPIDLMRHLVRLVTPPGGTVLDPFLGSGTTALAASEEGFHCIGIEREAEYLDIAKGRLIATPMGLGLDVA